MALLKSFPKLLISKIMRVVRFVLALYNPPYQLILTDKSLDKNANYYIYTFKLYGGHDFVSFSFKEITSNSRLLRIINPSDLIKINSNEQDHALNVNQYRIVETLRNNHYKLSNGKHVEIYSGQKICENIDMFNNINLYDLCHIAYETGILRGRAITKEILLAKEQPSAKVRSSSKDNVVLFQQGR